MEQTIYLLLDSRGAAIARGRIQGKTDGPYWQIQVEDGKIDEILEHKTLKLLSFMDAYPSYQGVIVRSRNDMIQLEMTKLTPAGEDMRKNLRVVVHFKSLIYPITGPWRGRREIEQNITQILTRNDLNPAAVSVRKMERPVTLTEVFPKIFEGMNSINVKA